MYRVGNIGSLIIVILVLLAVFMWLPFGTFSSPVSVLRSLGQVTALAGSVLFCLNFVLATRWRFVEELFSGINRAYIIHHIVGAVGFMFLLFHPVFLLLASLFVSLESAVYLITPSTNNFAVTFGTIALLLLIVLLLLTFYVRLTYDIWKKTHQWLGIPLCIALFHIYFIGSTLSQSPILKIYMFGMFVFGLYAYLYRIFMDRMTYGTIAYKVSHITTMHSVTQFSLKPIHMSLKFKPGQFAFIRVQANGITRESHPFSIISTPGDVELAFAVKSLGDYTNAIQRLKPNDTVFVEGPFGKFGYWFTKNQKQVWIGAGIGITPFISMLKSLPKTGYTITLLYCTREKSGDPLFQIIDNERKKNTQVQYMNWCSKDKGRLSGKQLVHLIPELETYDIFICGPQSMMRSLKSELINLGIPNASLHLEEFALS